MATYFNYVDDPELSFNCKKDVDLKASKRQLIQDEANLNYNRMIDADYLQKVNQIQNHKYDMQKLQQYQQQRNSEKKQFVQLFNEPQYEMLANQTNSMYKDYDKQNAGRAPTIDEIRASKAKSCAISQHQEPKSKVNELIEQHKQYYYYLNHGNEDANAIDIRAIQKKESQLKNASLLFVPKSNVLNKQETVTTLDFDIDQLLATSVNQEMFTQQMQDELRNVHLFNGSGTSYSNTIRRNQSNQMSADECSNGLQTASNRHQIKFKPAYKCQDTLNTNDENQQHTTAKLFSKNQHSSEDVQQFSEAKPDDLSLDDLFGDNEKQICVPVNEEILQPSIQFDFKQPFVFAPKRPINETDETDQKDQISPDQMLNSVEYTQKTEQPEVTLPQQQVQNEILDEEVEKIRVQNQTKRQQLVEVEQFTQVLQQQLDAKLSEAQDLKKKTEQQNLENKRLLQLVRQQQVVTPQQQVTDSQFNKMVADPIHQASKENKLNKVKFDSTNIRNLSIRQYRVTSPLHKRGEDNLRIQIPSNTSKSSSLHLQNSATNKPSRSVSTSKMQKYTSARPSVSQYANITEMHQQMFPQKVADQSEVEVVTGQYNPVRAEIMRTIAEKSQLIVPDKLQSFNLEDTNMSIQKRSVLQAMSQSTNTQAITQLQPTLLDPGFLRDAQMQNARKLKERVERGRQSTSRKNKQSENWYVNDIRQMSQQQMLKSQGRSLTLANKEIVDKIYQEYLDKSCQSRLQNRVTQEKQRILEDMLEERMIHNTYDIKRGPLAEDSNFVQDSRKDLEQMQSFLKNTRGIDYLAENIKSRIDVKNLNSQIMGQAESYQAKNQQSSLKDDILSSIKQKMEMNDDLVEISDPRQRALQIMYGDV